MELTPLKLLRILLPSLCIFYCLSTALTPLSKYHEAFGDESIYLDIFFDSNPRGKTNRRISFKAVLAGMEAEEVCIGHYFKTAHKETYVFQSKGGKFTGTLSPSFPGCEPELHYRLENESRLLKSGILKGGFCR
jgi:hypothetical protein